MIGLEGLDYTEQFLAFRISMQSNKNSSLIIFIYVNNVKVTIYDVILKFNLRMTRRCVSPRPVQFGIPRFVPISFVFFQNAPIFYFKKNFTRQANLQNKTICMKNNMYI